MAMINDYLNKNIFGNWTLYTNEISFSEPQNQEFPSRQIQETKNDHYYKGSWNHFSNNEVTKNPSVNLDRKILQNEDRLTNARTKQ